MRTALVLLAMVTASTSSFAQSNLDREEIEIIVREYLLKHPEILLEVQDALNRKQEAELAERQVATIDQNTEAIYNSPYQIEFGDPNAEITIVEFFDYNCGFCQRALADMQRMLENDKNVRFVLKEFPVLGEQSIDASRVSLAMSQLMPDKYPQFHVELLGLEGVKNGARAMQVAVDLGADEEKLLEEMEKPYIIDAMSEVYQIADGLGVTGTPSYIVGKSVVFGAVGYDQLKKELSAQFSE